MDIVAHTLWAGVAVAGLRHRTSIDRRAVLLTLSLAALPDIAQMLPVLAWWAFGSGTFDAVRTFAIAIPGEEPTMPAWVTLVSHHLHCTAHSAIIASIVTLIVWRLRHAFWLPLLGWWSHILIDVFTHSDDYYASPVLYPLTDRGFDGIAWITPWFMVINYVALGTVGIWLWINARSRRRESGQTDTPNVAAHRRVQTRRKE